MITYNHFFQFKFETLLDTHEYIKHLWGMTKNYLTSAIEIFSELQAKSTKIPFRHYSLLQRSVLWQEF